MLKTLLIIIIIILFSILSSAKMDIPIKRTQDPPKIDGLIIDNIWNNITPLPNLITYNPEEGITPTDSTAIYQTYDNEYIYFGFICYTKNPDMIRATVAPREKYEHDDFIAVSIDPYNSNRTAYLFYLNPYGNIKDVVFNTSGYMNNNWDIPVRAGAAIFEDRWEAEMAIPIKSLPFDDSKDKQRWGVYYLRMDNCHGELCVYPSRTHSIQNLLVQNGLLNGLINIKKGKNIELKPYCFSSYLNENEDTDFEIGINLDYSINPQLLSSATLNPDYSQIEADPLNINVNERNPQYLEEKRPFFSRSQSIFNTELLNLVYTRNIINPIAGVKFEGQYPNTIIGYLSAWDEGINKDKKNLYSIFRLKKNILQKSTIGVLITNKENLKKKHSNYLLSSDAMFELSQLDVLHGQVVFTISKEEKEKTAIGFSTKLQHKGDARYNELEITAIPTDFKAETGFIFESRHNRISVKTHNCFELPYLQQKTHKFEWYIGGEELFNYDLKSVEEYLWTGFECDWKNQMWTKFGFVYSHDYWHNKNFRTSRIETEFFKQFSGSFGLWLNTQIGGFPYYGDSEFDYDNGFNAWRFFMETGFNLNIFHRLSLSFNLIWNDYYLKLGGPRKFYSYNCRNEITWMIADKIYLRNILQGTYINLLFPEHADMEANTSTQIDNSMLLVYEYKPLSNIYFGFNLPKVDKFDNITKNLQIFFKINYLWCL